MNVAVIPHGKLQASVNETSPTTVSSFSPEILRLLMAGLACPAILYLGRSYGLRNSAFLDTNPSSLLILLYLCPVYATIAAVAFVWRSRLMFIASSIAVWLIVVAGSNITVAWDWRNAVYATKGVAPTGFLVTAICFAIMICTRYLGTKQLARIFLHMLGGIAIAVAMLWLTAVAAG